MNRTPQWISSLLICLAVCGATSLPADDGRPHAYSARRAYTAVGQPIDDAVMIVRSGRIAAIGSAADVAIPDDAVRHDLGDAVVIPGLVIAETSLGNTRDDERTLTPGVRAIDGFDFYADFSKYLAGGVTTVQISPGRGRLMPGQGAVVKLAGESPGERILSDVESLRIILTQASRTPPTIYEPTVGAVSVDNPLKPTRPQFSKSLAGAVAGLRAVFAASQGKAEDDPLLNAIADHTAEKRSIRVTASTAAEIRAALNLAREFEFPMILVDPVGLDPFVENLSVKGVVLNAGLRPGRITNPGIPDPEVPQPKKPWEYAALLREHGLADAVALRPAADDDLADMLFLGGLFTRSGADVNDALRMLTANPARILGVDDVVGSLAVGKDADFVVLTGEPFAAGSHVRATYISGAPEYDVDADRMTVIRAAAVHTGDGTIIRDAAVVVGGGKVRSVGADVSAPADARLRRFEDAVIVPGFIDLATGLGLGGPLSGSVSTSTKLGERLVANDANVEYARRGGITTAVLSPSGSPSPLMAFKLGRNARVLKDPVGLRFSVSSNLTAAVPALEKTLTQAKAYADGWTKYEAALAEYQKQLKAYELEKAKYDAAKRAEAAKQAAADAQKKAAEKPDDAKKDDARKDDARKDDEEKKGTGTPEQKPEKKEPEKSGDKPSGDAKSSAQKPEQASAGKPPAADQKPEKKEEAADPNAPKPPTEPKKPSTSTTLEPYRELFAGRIPALVEANSAKAVKAAVQVFRTKFKLRTIIVGGNDAYRVPELLAANDVSVVVGPGLVRDVEAQTVNLPQVLANHQITFGFQSKATTGAGQLPLAVQYAVHKGLGKTDALGGLTSGPARLLSLQDSVGTLAVGKDADLVVLSGPPFEVSSEVLAVMIDGEWVYEKENTP